MKFARVLLAVACLAISIPSESVEASIYDSNVVQHLQLTGTQKREMEKVIAESRVRRARIFKRHGIDPNAKPKIGRLMRAASELRANTRRERAAVKKILTREQLKMYDAIVRQTRKRIMSAF